MRSYLRAVGGESWLESRLGACEVVGAAGAGGDASLEPGAASAINAGELLVEFGGRACYRSWEPGLNPNVTKIRTDQREYFANILRSAHGSVLEHANFSFALRNCGRVFTHEKLRSEEHTSELQSRLHLVCRLLLEKK